MELGAKVPIMGREMTVVRVTTSQSKGVAASTGGFDMPFKVSDSKHIYEHTTRPWIEGQKVVTEKTEVWFALEPRALGRDFTITKVVTRPV